MFWAGFFVGLLVATAVALFAILCGLPEEW